jgi:hypothetical protein
MTKRVPPATAPVDSTEEKTDWLALVRWAARLDPDEPAAQAIARGAPIGELGYAAERGKQRERLVEPPPGADLLVVSGYLDDARQAVGRGHKLYSIAVYAYSRQDGWSDAEHRAYWAAHLLLWPPKRGRPRNVESLAFAIVQAGVVGVPAEAMPDLLAYSHDDLRDRHVLDLAKHMRAELDQPRHVRVPRVVTNDELDAMPLLTGYQTLSAEEGARAARVGSAALHAVAAGAAAVVRWHEGAPPPRHP